MSSDEPDEATEVVGAEGGCGDRVEDADPKLDRSEATSSSADTPGEKAADDSAKVESTSSAAIGAADGSAPQEEAASVAIVSRSEASVEVDNTSSPASTQQGESSSSATCAQKSIAEEKEEGERIKDTEIDPTTKSAACNSEEGVAGDGGTKDGHDRDNEGADNGGKTETAAAKVGGEIAIKSEDAEAKADLSTEEGGKTDWHDRDDEGAGNKGGEMVEKAPAVGEVAIKMEDNQSKAESSVHNLRRPRSDSKVVFAPSPEKDDDVAHTSEPTWEHQPAGGGHSKPRGLSLDLNLAANADDASMGIPDLGLSTPRSLVAAASGESLSPSAFLGVMVASPGSASRAASGASTAGGDGAAGNNAATTGSGAGTSAEGARGDGPPTEVLVAPGRPQSEEASEVAIKAEEAGEAKAEVFASNLRRPRSDSKVAFAPSPKKDYKARGAGKSDAATDGMSKSRGLSLDLNLSAIADDASMGIPDLGLSTPWSLMAAASGESLSPSEFLGVMVASPGGASRAASGASTVEGDCSAGNTAATICSGAGASTSVSVEGDRSDGPPTEVLVVAPCRSRSEEADKVAIKADEAGEANAEVSTSNLRRPRSDSKVAFAPSPERDYIFRRAEKSDAAADGKPKSRGLSLDLNLAAMTDNLDVGLSTPRSQFGVAESVSPSFLAVMMASPGGASKAKSAASKAGDKYVTGETSAAKFTFGSADDGENHHDRPPIGEVVVAPGRLRSDSHITFAPETDFGVSPGGGLLAPPSEVLVDHSRPRSDSRISFAADTFLDHPHPPPRKYSNAEASAATSGEGRSRALSLDLSLTGDVGSHHFGLGSLVDSEAATPRSHGGTGGGGGTGSCPNSRELLAVMVASPSASNTGSSAAGTRSMGDNDDAAAPVLPMLSMLPAPKSHSQPLRKRKLSIDIQIPDGSHGGGEDDGDSASGKEAEPSALKRAKTEEGGDEGSSHFAESAGDSTAASGSHTDGGDASSKAQHRHDDILSHHDSTAEADSASAALEGGSILPRRRHGFSFDATFPDDCSASMASAASRASVHHLPSSKHGGSVSGGSSSHHHHAPMRKRKLSLDISLPSSDGGGAANLLPDHHSTQLQSPQQHHHSHNHLPDPGAVERRHQPLKKRSLSVDVDFGDMCSVPDSAAASAVPATATQQRPEDDAVRLKAQALEKQTSALLDHLDALGDDDHAHADTQKPPPPPPVAASAAAAASESAARIRGLSMASSGPVRKRKLSMDMSLRSADLAAMPGMHGSSASLDRLIVGSKKSFDGEKSGGGGPGAKAQRKGSDGDRSGAGAGGAARPGRKSSDGDRSGSSKDGLVIVTDNAGGSASRSRSPSPHPGRKSSDADESGGSGSTLNPCNQRLLLEALLHDKEERRNRAESWGGMSDLSVAVGGHHSGGHHHHGQLGRKDPHAMTEAAEAIATIGALHSTGLLEDITAAADGIVRGAGGGAPGGHSLDGHSLDGGGILGGLDGGASANCPTVDHASAAAAAAVDMAAPEAPPIHGKEIELVMPSPSPTHAGSGAADAVAVAVTVTTKGEADGNAVGGRARKDSIASLGSASLGGSMVSYEPKVKPKPPEPKLDVQSIIASAMGNVSAQLENGAAGRGGVRKNSADLVADAMAAAAAGGVGAIDYASIAGMASAVTRRTPTGTIGRTAYAPRPRPALPPKPPPLPPMPIPSTGGRDMEAIRARARAAAGYVPPGTPGAPYAAPASKKKKAANSSGAGGANLHTPQKFAGGGGTTLPPYGTPIIVRSGVPGAYQPVGTPGGTAGGARPSHPSMYATPQMSNRTGHRPPPGSGPVPMSVHSTLYSTHGGRPHPYATPQPRQPRTPAPASSNSNNQANQKWEEMYDALIAYIARKRSEECEGLSDEEKAEWKWEGNVPTSYKTNDGKALGRWINNQRSAKNKGSLKRDREVRLVGAGLKWSVLSTNAWPDMFQELQIYIREKTKDGKDWDGNVPTNYRIKNENGSELDEDKNLGRWINRQRSLFQSGKLKKHRQLELEKIGLRWSVLSTVSWDDMYNSLCAYAACQRADHPHQQWDGNVPANHRTDDAPPRSLGRWVNRQRCAFAKKKLKPDLEAKLEQIGLRWCVHEKKSIGLREDLASPSLAPSPAAPGALHQQPPSADSGGVGEGEPVVGQQAPVAGAISALKTEAI